MIGLAQMGVAWAKMLGLEDVHVDEVELDGVHEDGTEHAEVHVSGRQPRRLDKIEMEVKIE